jgi:hypothetical protein
LRRDFLFSFGLVALSERDFSIVVDGAVSPRSTDGRASVALALRIAFGEGLAPEVP